MTCKPKTGGCVGQCCASFHLTKATQLDIMNGRTEDDRTIRAMLVPLGDGNFTCKHWVHGLCAIHAIRPQMCRSFPAKGNPCGIDGCKEPNHE